MGFKRAERKRAKLRLAIDGPAGSGKTYSALLIARGLVGPEGKVAVLDTEEGSAELYSDLTEFDHDRLNPPFSPDRYIASIREAETAGYDCLIIDSLSHAWSGTGGVLDIKDAATKASRSGNSFDAWRTVTPQHNALVDAILRSKLHIIACIRTKTAWEIVEDEKGKKKPIKIGTKPEQREGLEYEFTCVLDLSVEGHIATASKDRTRLFDGKFEVPTVKTGERLRQWLDSGVDAEAAAAETRKAQEEQCNAFLARAAELGRIDSPAGVIRALDNWKTKHLQELRALPLDMQRQIRDEMQKHTGAAQAVLDGGQDGIAQ